MFLVRFRSEVLYHEQLKQNMMKGVMTGSGHLTTLAIILIAVLGLFIGYSIKNVNFLLVNPSSGVLLIFSFITLNNLVSFIRIPSIG